VKKGILKRIVERRGKTGGRGTGQKRRERAKTVFFRGTGR